MKIAQQPASQKVSTSQTSAATQKQVAQAAEPAKAARTASATSDGSPEATLERSARVSNVKAAAPASPAEVVSKFYAAFEKGDVATMAPLYDKNLKFDDMIFHYSNREGAMHMWTKILANPGNKIKFTLDSVEGNQVKGHWVADYVLNGRKVHNELTTEMTVENGLITKHKDSSDWNKWAPQAIPLGHLALLPGIKQAAMALIRSNIDG